MHPLALSPQWQLHAQADPFPDQFAVFPFLNALIAGFAGLSYHQACSDGQVILRFSDVFVNDIWGQFLIRIGARDSCECVTANQIWGPCDNEKGLPYMLEVFFLDRHSVS